MRLYRDILVYLSACGLAAGALEIQTPNDGSSTLVFRGKRGSMTHKATSGSLRPHLTATAPTSRVKRVAQDKSLSFSKISDRVVHVEVRQEDDDQDDEIDDEEADDASAVTVEFTFPEDDVFYGVWEYPWNGSIANKDVKFEVKGLVGEQQGVNYANARAPFFFTKSGFGIHIPTLDMGSFEFSKGRAGFLFENSDAKYTVLYNEDLKGLLAEYAELSAKISMPPDSGYGPIFWSDNMLTDFHGDVENGEENYYDIADHLYDKEIRATAMFADRPYGTGNWSFGNFDFDPEFFPDPEAFIANLSDRGYDFQVWVANRAFLNTELYLDALKNKWLFPGIDGEIFLGPALDLRIPEAYAYFKEKLTAFTDLGVKGFKIDRGEELEMPDEQQNIQSVLFAQLCHEVMVEKWGESNYFSFSRSIVDEARGLSAVWNGDPMATFEGLRYSVASGIRAGLLLYSTWGSDVGGYTRNDNRPSEEVWARWMQFGAFSPMYEIMVGDGHTPWYKPYTEDLVAVLKQTTDWHTKLIPYIRSYTYQATQTGIPVIRALFLEYPDDEDAYEASDAYSFGAELFVAPFVRSGGSRRVQFPKTESGVKFVDYLNKEDVYEGGTTETIELGLDAMPVYVREGSIIPTGDVYQGNAKWVEDWEPRLEVEFYPSYRVPESTFSYYRSDGEVAKITMTTNVEGGSVSISSDQLGAGGVYRIYGKNGPLELDLPDETQTVTVTLNSFATLFDE